MKRKALPLIALVMSMALLCALLPGLAGCADSGTVKDNYGFERPAKITWLSQSLLLPGMPPLEQLFGTGGESGLLSEYAIENNGKLNSGGTNYLVTLCYGTPQVFDLHTYLRFVLVSADGILYDEECVEVGSTLQYGIPVESFRMDAAPDARLGIKSSGPNMQGAVVIPFTVKDGLEGILYVYCSLDSPGEFEHYYVGDRAEARIGDATGGNEVSIDRITVGYLGQAAYNEGNFEEAAIAGIPTFEDSAPCYMVLDLAFTARKSNDGSLSLGCFVCIPDETGACVTLEEAPTGKVERTLENGILRFDASYGIPKGEGEQKSVRMILRLNDGSVLTNGIELFLCGSRGTSLTGTAHIADVMEWVNPTPDIVEGEKSETPTWGKVVMAVAALGVFMLCYAIMRELFDDGEGKRIFFVLLAFVLSAATLAMMLVYSTWAWWVVALVELGCILLVLFLSGIACISRTRRDEEVIVSFVPLALMPIPLILFTSWSWWAILIATLAWMIFSYFVEFQWSLEIVASRGKCLPLWFSALLCVAAPAVLLIFTAWAWWVILLAELGVIALSTLLAGLIGKVL